MTTKIDDVDKKILSCLERDGRVAYTKIGDDLGLSEATIRKRVKHMTETGIVKIVGVVNPAAMGKTTTAIVGLSIDGKKAEGIIEKLSEFDEIAYIVACAGVYDLIIKVVVDSTDELYKFLADDLRHVEGIVSSETSLVMRVCKDSFNYISK